MKREETEKSEVNKIEKNIQVNNNEFLEKHNEKIYEIITIFKNDIKKEFDIINTKREDFVLLYKISEEDEFSKFVEKNVLHYIKKKLQPLILIDNIDSIKTFSTNQYNFELIIGTYIKLCDSVLENLYDKLMFDSIKSITIENIFINSLFEVFFKILYFKQRYTIFFTSFDKNVNKDNFFNFKTSADCISYLKNVTQIFEVFQIYFGNFIDYRSFFSNVVCKYESFFNLFSDSFDLILVKENSKIIDSFFNKMNGKTIEIHTPNIDYIFKDFFSDLLKSHRIALGFSRNMNETKKIEISDGDNLFKNKYKWDVKTTCKGKKEIFLLSSFSNYLSYFKSNIIELSKLKLFGETYVILLMNKVIFFLENILKDVTFTLIKVTKLFYLNESVEEVLIFYSSLKYLEQKFLRIITKFYSNQVYNEVTRYFDSNLRRYC